MDSRLKNFKNQLFKKIDERDSRLKQLKKDNCQVWIEDYCTTKRRAERALMWYNEGYNSGGNVLDKLKDYIEDVEDDIEELKELGY